jgi:hypothetical protein
MRLFAPKGPKDVLKSSKQNVKEGIRDLDRELNVSQGPVLYTVEASDNINHHCQPTHLCRT